MAEFIVPPVEEVKPALSPEEASREAFYAAATTSPDPVKDYKVIKADLELTGSSAFVDMAQTAWKNEQDEKVRNIVQSILVDQSIPKDKKKVILQTYALTGFIQPSLKEKYVQQVAAKQIGPTSDDTLAQDIIVDTLQTRRKVNEVETIFDKGEKFVDSVLGDNVKQSIVDSVIGIGAAITDVLVAFPAGIGKIYSLIKDKDEAKAKELEERIKDWAFDPDSEGAQKKREAILEDLSKLGAIGQTAAKKERELLEAKMSPEERKRKAWKLALLEMKTSLLEDPFTYIGVGILARNVGKKGQPKISPESPLATTEMANPQAAEKLAASSIAERTGVQVEAIGADKGTIIHDWVLSKPMPDAEQRMHPDLVEELKRLDHEARTTFQEYRYDPNFVEATRREEEVSRVFNVIKEQRSPYYQQSNSTILETDNVFEGNAVYGRNASSGYLREKDAQAALERLQESLNTLPEDLRGTVELFKDGSEWYIKHNWKKEYDELSAFTFGPDSIQTSMLGIDVSGIARSSLGRWLFPTGWLPKWAEAGAARSISRAAVIESNLIKNHRGKISETPYGKELTSLIDEAEQVGKDYFSPAEISSRFPHLSTKQVNELFETHTIWRRFQEYNYNFFNRIERNELESKGMQGLYDNNGNYIGPATTRVPDSERTTIQSVWNFDSDNILDYTDQLKIRQDKTLVRLYSPMRIGDEVINYGLVGSKHKLGMLPTETLPRIPGYSPRRVRENFFVDIVPTTLKVDGISVKDPIKLRNYSLTKAAARNEQEANAIAAEIQSMYPDHKVEVRPERTDNYGQLVTDYRVYNEMFRHSMKRGDRLPSRNGPARIEDRLLTEINSVKTLSRMEAFRTWDETFQKSFVNAFAKFLPKREFPMLKTDIRPLENMDHTLKQEFDTAQRLYAYYARQKNFETMGDFLWKKGMWRLADVLEKFRIPAELVRDLGKLGNPLMAAKTVATSLFIHMSPSRQWLLQPAQMAEIVAIRPVSGIKNLTLIPQIMLELGSDANAVKRYSRMLKFVTGLMDKANTKVGATSKGEFADIMKGIRQSGIVQSVDMNSIVHGVFKDVDQAFVPTTWEAAWSKIKQAVGFGPKVGRSIGFDPAEITNQIGTWLQARDLWIERNPGKKWNTKEVFEQISHESWRLSGNMTRAGNLPYQEGALSILFQFAAIQQKLLMNILQDNATMLSPSQRAKLQALRLGLYGVKYGLPGGAAAYYFIDRHADDQVQEVMNRPEIRRGLIDSAVNGTIASIVEPDERTDLAVSKMFSPYSEAFLPYLDVAHSTWMMIDQDQYTNPRYPVVSVLSGFGKFIDDMQGWWITRDVNEDTYKRMFMEGAELASGLNSYWQGQLMLGMQDKVSRMGNKYDIQIVKGEAYAKMYFGITTQKEEDLWNLVKNEKDFKARKKELAQNVHTQLMNMKHKAGEEDYDIYMRRLNSFMSTLDPKYFNEMDKIEVMEEITKLDRRSFTETRQSVFASIWARHSSEMTKDREIAMDILKRSELPQAKELATALEEGKL